MSDIDLKALRPDAVELHRQAVEFASGNRDLADLDLLAVAGGAALLLPLIDRLESAERRAEEAEKERDALKAEHNYDDGRAHEALEREPDIDALRKAEAVLARQFEAIQGAARPPRWQDLAEALEWVRGRLPRMAQEGGQPRETFAQRRAEVEQSIRRGARMTDHRMSLVDKPLNLQGQQVDKSADLQGPDAGAEDPGWPPESGVIAGDKGGAGDVGGHPSAQEGGK